MVTATATATDNYVMISNGKYVSLHRGNITLTENFDSAIEVENKEQASNWCGQYKNYRLLSVTDELAMALTRTPELINDLIKNDA